MAKNIIIYSDGTGQSGGLTPDQRLSNVYKMFRATRVGPDNLVDPADQIAFYDPGLGTASDSGNIPLEIYGAVRRFASSATGAGLGKNITDCYEAILKHYEDGDRIYLVGFSRGAYTARCVAGVLRLCGVPRQMPHGGPIPRGGSALRTIASEAVHNVYEHGSGRKRSRFEPERIELARRFRAKYDCGTATDPNVSPYFIGVFDSVAALGASGLRAFLMNLALVLGILAGPASLAGFLQLLGLASFWTAFAWSGAAAAVVALAIIVRHRLRVIWRYPSGRRFSAHWTGWRFRDYDTNLDSRVAYARHAQAIDETRDDFKRVPWGQPSEGDRPREEGCPEPFVQLWFPGNHSDIGGSYPEDESRLSDIALKWMSDEMAALPHPVLFDRSKLNLYPSAAGMQHCEVESLLDAYPWWWPRRLRRSWKASPRFTASGAPYHPSVAERLALPSVSQCGRVAPYRPLALSKDPALASLYPATPPELAAPGADK